MGERRIVILGAGGRDFHNFLVYFKDNPQYRVVAFTATQIPNIDSRILPPELAGERYPQGIPIYPEDKLPELISNGVEEVFLSYSDLTAEEFSRKANWVLSLGASFSVLDPFKTMLSSRKPVIAVCASRTGAGKSTVSRKVSRILKKMGLKVGVVRHPMVYGDFRKQKVQRFRSVDDLVSNGCTIEEREEYEPHIEMGNVVYAGIDYREILRMAEEESDVILWDGGNNDLPFFRPGLWITVVDPFRPGDEIYSFPGGANTMMADVVIINKVNTAPPENVKAVEDNVRRVNPRAVVIKAASEITVSEPDLIRGRRVVVVEDGPTVTHGNLGYAAGFIAAKKYGAAEIIDPRPYAVGSIKEAYDKYSHLKNVVPALGYGERQMRELEETLNSIKADAIVLGTPSNLARYLRLNKPVARVRYELREIGGEKLEHIIAAFLSKTGVIGAKASSGS